MKLLATACLLLTAAPALAYEVPAVEPVYSVTAGKAGVTVRLASNGCTKKSDLTVAVAKNPPRPLILVARKHPDSCKAIAPGHADIVWSYADLGLEAGQPFSVGNPLTADPSPQP